MASTSTRISRAAFNAALRRVVDTTFDCGEWQRDESDEPYDTVHNRALVAERRLRELIEPFLTDPALTRPADGPRALPRLSR